MTNTGTSKAAEAWRRQLTERQARHLLLSAAHSLTAENGKFPSAQDHQAKEVRARLIAAAPDMADCLRYIAETIPQAYHAQGPEVVAREMEHAARALLARIRGDA